MANTWDTPLLSHNDRADARTAAININIASTSDNEVSLLIRTSIRLTVPLRLSVRVDQDPLPKRVLGQPCHTHAGMSGSGGQVSDAGRERCPMLLAADKKHAHMERQSTRWSMHVDAPRMLNLALAMRMQISARGLTHVCMHVCRHTTGLFAVFGLDWSWAGLSC